MTLENTFYTLGIVYMVLGLLILIAVAVLIFFLYKKITQITKRVDDTVDQVQRMADHPGQTAYAIGAKVAQTAMKNRSRKKSSSKK